MPETPQSDPSSSRVEELVAKCLEHVERDGDPHFEEVCRESPDLRSVVERRIAMLKKIGLLSETVEPDGAPPRAQRDFPELLGDFRLIRRIGGGGMGVVYLARQESLGREVALKLIRPEHLYFGGAHDRFRREVEAVARLDHPGIVPIYTVGQEKGIPFFAMQAVDGRSLSEIVEELRGRRPETLTAADFGAAILKTNLEEARALGDRVGPTWIQSCLKMAWQVASALAHAHARGVIHRDVKPSNVLLTKDGRAVLLDFGLATLRGADKLTKTGSALGSPHYMAPEVYASGGDAADARADVYSLGVTLFEMLALQLPFSGGSEELMARILSGEIAPLRKLNPLVSWDVETVCMKAMDVDRDRRYPSAAEFAADLLNVLELRPIAAARPSLLLRVRRFAQRRPGSAMAFVLAFFITVIFPLGYSMALRRKSIEIERQNQEIAKQKDEAQRQQRVAESHRNATLQAIDAMIASLADPALTEVPGIVSVRRRVFEQAQSVVDQLGGAEREQPEVKRRVVNIESGLGHLLAALGDHQGALTRLEGVLAEMERLYGKEPADPDVRRGIADEKRLCAELLSDLGRSEEAAARIGESLATFREHLVANPDDLGAARAFTTAIATARSIQFDRGDLAAQAALDRESDDFSVAALARWPDDPLLNMWRLDRLSSAALREAAYSKPDAARDYLAQVDRLLTEIERRGVDITQIDRMAVCFIRSNSAEAFEELGDYAASVALLEQAIARARDVAARYPERPACRHLLGRCLAQIAENRNFIEYATPEANDAAYRRSLDEFREAIAILRKIRGEGVNDEGIDTDLSAALGSYGDWLSRGGSFETAESAYRESIQLLEQCLEANPNAPNNLDNHVVTLCELGRTLTSVGREDEAIESLGRAWVALVDMRAKLLISDETYWQRAALNRGVLARALLGLGRHGEAFARLCDLAEGKFGGEDALFVLQLFSTCIDVAVADAALETTAREKAIADYAERGIDLLDALVREGSLSLATVGKDEHLAALRATPRYSEWGADKGL